MNENANYYNELNFSEHMNVNKAIANKKKKVFHVKLKTHNCK